jgi:hypothetical protein
MEPGRAALAQWLAEADGIANQKGYLAAEYRV